jgi:hypothetical protein
MAPGVGAAEGRPERPASATLVSAQTGRVRTRLVNHARLQNSSLPTDLQG